MESWEPGESRDPGEVAGVSLLSRVRPTVPTSLYVAGVTVLAGVGFIGDTPWPILLAALLTAPASIVALPAYYLVYGLLALVPGANPTASSGSATGGAPGPAQSTEVVGATASWFTSATHLLGIATFAGAAVLNVVIARAYIARRAR